MDNKFVSHLIDNAKSNLLNLKTQQMKFTGLCLFIYGIMIGTYMYYSDFHSNTAAKFGLFMICIIFALNTIYTNTKLLGQMFHIVNNNKLRIECEKYGMKVHDGDELTHFIIQIGAIASGLVAVEIIFLKF